MLVFPLVKPQTRRSLVKRWSGRLLRILAVQTRVDGEIDAARRQRDAGREPHLLARHLRAQRRATRCASSPSRNSTRWPVAAPSDPRRRNRLHRARPAPRHPARQPPAAQPLAARRRGRDRSRKARPPTAPTVLPSSVRCCSRSSRRRATCMPVAIRYRARRRRSTASVAAYVGDESFATSFWRVCGERALVVELTRAAALPAQRRPPARARARGGGGYPNGFGATGCRVGTW